ncbi:MAG: pyridoxal-phosphate dependent enzyme [Ignavibacteriaceae bacterium]|nr:pyridoxal-phosphate dependent enzyme [Ignavibacteria bacterium]MBT8392366.1 pyridoxal-phosphate dependent enzyme [Ignavibacteria bacterium]NNJ53118.1 pyridoxal-phosphate dependent enzyme [Ignavibacteriaceae bacterium]NNL22210.1 pyridoxal-phosphate dependent enzyme [Ignavibacteriaceae bacterium]
MIIPKKLEFAHLPTPIEKLKFRNRNFLIKRDDYTGSDFLGNKIRKLEYLLYEAKKEKADIIFTCGGDQSNHARATASAAAKLGIKTRLYLWGNKKIKKDANLFLNKMYGAEIIYMNKKEFFKVDEVMTEKRKELIKKGRKVYVIPAGGSSTLGIWGYISFIEELKKQINLKNVQGIFSACGSGGTAAGLLVGAVLNKLNLKIFAVNVLLAKEEIRKKILQLAEGAKLVYKLPIEIDEAQLEIIDGYSNEGYKNITDKKLKLISEFSRSTGILLDPAYSGKAFSAYNDLILKKGKGNKVIFLHTGGIYGTFSKRAKYLEHN